MTWFKKSELLVGVQPLYLHTEFSPDSNTTISDKDTWHVDVAVSVRLVADRRLNLSYNLSLRTTKWISPFPEVVE
jgi:hypothetical protein